MRYEKTSGQSSELQLALVTPNYRYFVDTLWNASFVYFKNRKYKRKQLDFFFHESDIVPATRPQQSISKFSVCKPTYTYITPPYYFRLKFWFFYFLHLRKLRRIINWIVEWLMCLAIKLCMLMGYSYGVTNSAALWNVFWLRRACLSGVAWLLCGQVLHLVASLLNRRQKQ